MPQQQRQREVRSAGSGVIVDADNGYVLTAAHVVNHYDEREIADLLYVSHKDYIKTKHRAAET